MGGGRCSFDVLDARGRVHVELTPAFAQQKLNGAKISFVDLDVLFELGPGVDMSIGTLDSSDEGVLFTSQMLGNDAVLLLAFFGILGDIADTGRAPLFEDLIGALCR